MPSRDVDQLSEAKVESKFNGMCESRGAITRKFVSPGRRSVTDRLVFWSHGVVHLVEVKKAGEVPTKLQNHEHRELRKLGHRVFVLAGLREVVDYFNLEEVKALSDIHRHSCISTDNKNGEVC